MALICGYGCFFFLDQLTTELKLINNNLNNNKNYNSIWKACVFMLIIFLFYLVQCNLLLK